VSFALSSSKSCCLAGSGRTDNCLSSFLICERILASSIIRLASCSGAIAALATTVLSCVSTSANWLKTSLSIAARTIGPLRVF
jgi:hydrogenase-4 membrane subunit HyfE